MYGFNMALWMKVTFKKDPAVVIMTQEVTDHTSIVIDPSNVAKMEA